MIVDDENTTCSVLKRLAADAEFFECTADNVEPCASVNCIQTDIPGKEYTAVITLLPCMTPTAVRVEIVEGETVLLNEVVSESQEITVEDLFGIVLNITLDHFKDAIGLQVSIYKALFIHVFELGVNFGSI